MSRWWCCLTGRSSSTVVWYVLIEALMKGWVNDDVGVQCWR